jgi:hypothetical protein
MLGASFVPVTLMVMVSVSVAPNSSATCAVKCSAAVSPCARFWVAMRVLSRL